MIGRKRAMIGLRECRHVGDSRLTGAKTFEWVSIAQSVKYRQSMRYEGNTLRRYRHGIGRGLFRRSSALFECLR